MMLTFAIGDIHGDLRKLDRVLASCMAYADGRALRFVFVGDYVDRGPDSRGVIDRIMELEKKFDTVALKGNHEVMLLTAALTNSDPSVRFWVDHGGIATLNSFRIQEIDARLIPEKYLRWMHERPVFFDDGQRFFVHGGIDWNRPLNRQSEDVMLWTRTPYVEGASAARYIVHGHTPAEIPEIREAILNIDTGCGFGGPLTAAVFDGPDHKAVAFIFDGRLIESSHFETDARNRAFD